MLQKLQSTVVECLSHAHQSDLLPRHELTVIEDEETLAGADPHAVRQAFRAWVAKDLTPRLNTPERFGGILEAHRKLLSNDTHEIGRAHV